MEDKMSKFNKIDTGIEGLIVIEPQVFGDNRGFFMETFTKKDFEELGIMDEFVQDNHSKSKKGVLRGLHFQTKFTQGKLIRVTAGRVLDVGVDLRYDSKTFGKWYKIELTAENKKMFYLPKGFAHGFVALDDDTEFQYKCTDYYAPEYDSGVLWNDKDIGIDWEFDKFGLRENEVILSEKDKVQQTLREFVEKGIKL
jgi:dTDP-4-dehydrorhamnose 3,5-epimerase